MFNITERPNGNLTIREYDRAGNLRNKLVEKGPKVYLTFFLPKKNSFNQIIYDNTDRVVVSKEGKHIADLNKKVYFRVQDKLVKMQHKIMLALSKEDREGYKFITKADGKKYLRRKEPLLLDPKKKFLHKIAYKLHTATTALIRAEYLKEVMKRKI